MFKKVLLVLAIVLIAASAAYFYLSQTYPGTSPFLTGSYYIESIMKPHSKLNKHVMGFLPYWRVDDIDNIKPQHLSEINYFSISPDTDGKITKQINGETEPGFREWNTEKMKNFKTKSQIMGTDFTITVAALNNDLLASLLENPQAQKTLVSEIISLIKTNKLDGVNIDFEYFGEPAPEYKETFTSFSKQLSTEMKQETPTAHLSLSIMPRAARDPDIYDFPELVKLYDRFIGMSYDYYGIGSDIAGPVSPMQGYKDKKYFFDVETTYADYRKYIPAEKIVMGVPYYGWDRAVENGKEIKSLTFPTDDEKNYAAVISYARARETKDFKKTDCKWDSVAQETWCWYTKDGIDHQVWLADNKSIQIRFDYANKQDFGGIGIWVLGYDKDYPDLWEMIQTKFASN